MMSTRCASCGHVPSSPAPFCTRCGARLVVAPPPWRDGCPSCGAQVRPGARFCAACGAPARSASGPAPAPVPTAGRGGPSSTRGPGPLRHLAATAVVAVAAFVAWAVTPVGAPRSDPASGPTASVAGVRVEMPAGAPAATVASAGDLARLRALSGGERLVVAARLGPDGLAVPGGASVTFALPARRAPGEALSMVALDEVAGRWRRTGEVARVAADGASATGRVWHFSTHGAEEEREEPALRTTTAVVSRGVSTIDPAKLESVLDVYGREVVAKGGVMSLDAMKAIYAAGDFHVVKTLIEDGKISSQHSMDMADLRILMALRALEAVAARKGWRIHRSDSGNQSAGMSSDIDQTVYVERREGDRWVRHEDGDAELVGLFREQFRAESGGLDVEVFDIATIAGRDKFPDPRVNRVQLEDTGRRQFAQHARETMFTLRRTPGAYTFCGAVVQQMQLRVLSQVERVLREGRDAPAPTEPRPIHHELRAHAPELRLNQLLLLTIGPGEGDDAAVRPREAFREDAMRVMFDDLPPRLVRGHAYDAVVANYFEFMHHLEDPLPAVKYHLRALDDGLSRLHALDTGTERLEYGAVPPDRRAALLARVLGSDLAERRWDGTSFLDRWRAAFDVSAQLRELHSAKRLTPAAAEEAFRPLATEIAVSVERAALSAEVAAGRRPRGTATAADAEARVRADPEAWRRQLPAARTEYDRRCQEFMLHAMVATARERVAEFVSPHAESADARALLAQAIDEGPLRGQLQLEGPQHEEAWQRHRDEFVRNHSFQAEMQLLYSFRELHATRPDLVAMILEDARRRLPAADVARLETVAKASRSWFFGLTELGAFPRTTLRFAALAGRRTAADFATRIGRWALAEVGWTDDPGTPRPSAMLRTLGLHGLHARLQRTLETHRTAGFADRFLGKTFVNPGALVGLSAVLRDYSTSDGDPDALARGLARETVNLLPVVGLGLGAYEAGLDPLQQALVWGPLLVPELGIVVACSAIGENALVIYEHEIAAPLADATADALYRGYVGPSLYDLSADGAPPQFSDADATHLATLDGLVDELTSRVAQDGSVRATARALAQATRERSELTAKRDAWNTYVHEDERRKHGGALLHMGGSESQQALRLPAVAEHAGAPQAHEGALLARVEPVIFYARDAARGPVDFRVKALTEAEVARLAGLDAALGEPQLPADLLALRAERDRLAARRDERVRADAHLARAAQNLELAHQIRRDSLYPYLLDHRHETPRMEDPSYVDRWVAIRRELLAAELERVGVAGARPHASEILQALSVRLVSDLQRSRRLWLARQALLEAQAKAAEVQRSRALVLLEAERAMIAAIDRPLAVGEDAAAALRAAGADPREATSPVAFARALLERHLPASAPRLELGVRRVERAGAAGAPAEHEYRPDVVVEADPAVYRPPYTAVAVPLDPVEGRAVLGAGAWRGLPLDERMQATLRDHLARVGEVPADFDPKVSAWTPCVLVFAFCRDVQVSARVVSETVAHLPRPRAVPIPLPEGMPGLPADVAQGHLLGGAALAPEVEVVRGAVRIEMVGGPDRRADVVDVTSLALARLPRDAETGLLFRLHRATTQAGLAKSRAVAEALVRGDTPVVGDLSAGAPGRFAPDRLRMVAPSPDESADERGPYWYQVVQVAATGRFTAEAAPVGDPERSNVIGPSPEVRVRPTPDAAGWLRGEDARQIDVALGVGGQRHVVSGAHLVFRTRGGTWHRFAPRLEGDRQVGGDPRGDGAWVRFSLGDVVEDLEVAIEAEGDGMRAQRVVRVRAAPAAVERVAQGERTAAERRADNARFAEQRRADARRRVDGARASLEEFRRRFAGQGWYGAQSIANAEAELRAATAAAAMVDEFEVPDRDASVDEQAALVRSDAAALVAALTRRLALADRRGVLRREAAEAEFRALESMLGAAPDASARAGLEGRVALARRTVDGAADAANDDVEDIASRLASAALEAGDARACRDAHARYVRALDASKESGRRDARAHAEARGLIFLRIADDMARLTGNRPQSRTVHEEGLRWLLEAAAPEQRAALEERFARGALPEWWPPS